MISKSQQALLSVLKTSLFDVRLNSPVSTDWNEVISEARAQTVIGLISNYVPGLDLSSEQVKTSYMRIMYEQNRLLALLNSCSIPCVILKGSAAAVYYPKPYLRTMGDIDFLVPRTMFKDAIKILNTNGYTYVHGDNRDMGFIKNGVEFELHHHFSSRGFNIDDILENAINRRDICELNGYQFPILPKCENGLVLIGHINQHLKRNCLGLRQIIDWCMYIHSMANDSQWKANFEPLLSSAGLIKLAASVTKMCNKYLGLPEIIDWSIKTEKGVEDELIKVIMNDGNFGRRNETAATNNDKALEVALYGYKSMGCFAYFRDIGLSTWKACKRYPFLRHFAFIYGFFRQLFKGCYMMLKGNGVVKNYKEGNKRYELYKKLGVRN